MRHERLRSLSAVVAAALVLPVSACSSTVLRAYAASPDLEDRWGTPQEYVNEDGSITVSPNDLGFNGPPRVREVREHYDITPV